jgi:alkanesulfonate monooxygenase SsuD/methylene tetrahydromethanopterin reductase-like flavin-dependent oxidoreductase (luciferase family)
MERVGFAVGYDPAMDGRDMAHWMGEAERRGFELGFFSETIELMRDSVSSLTAIGLATGKLVIGCTQIVRLRTPLVMAQTAAALDELTGGRVLLAPGACTNTHAKRHGLEPIEPGVTLREWIESMRLILSGERVSYHGQVVHFDDVQLGFQPNRPRIPMLIPATSRTGLRIAGQIGDGVLLNAICSPEYSVNALKIVRQAVEEAGRDWEGFEVAQLVNCSVEDDEQTALDAIRWEVASKLDPIQLPFIAGPKMRVGEPYFHPEDFPGFEEAWRRGGKQALIEAVPDAYVRGMTASGTPQQVKAKVQQYRDVGVRLPVLRPAAAHQAERLLDLFSPS